MSKILLAALALVTSAVGFATIAGAVEDADVECDPYPIGRCGAFQRESVIYCYKSGYPLGVYHSATETNAESLTWPGAPTPILTPVTAPKTLAYLYKAPSDAFLADPYESDLPFDSIWQETNAVAGLQIKAFKCGNFQWFEECIPPQWMGPYGVQVKQPDAVVA